MRIIVHFQLFQVLFSTVVSGFWRQIPHLSEGPKYIMYFSPPFKHETTADGRVTNYLRTFSTDVWKSNSGRGCRSRPLDCLTSYSPAGVLSSPHLLFCTYKTHFIPPTPTRQNCFVWSGWRRWCEHNSRLLKTFEPENFHSGNYFTPAGSIKWFCRRLLSLPLKATTLFQVSYCHS